MVWRRQCKRQMSWCSLLLDTGAGASSSKPVGASSPGQVGPLEQKLTELRGKLRTKVEARKDSVAVVLAKKAGAAAVTDKPSNKKTRASF